MASNEGHGFARGDAGDYAILVVFFIFVLLTVLVTANNHSAVSERARIREADAARLTQEKNSQRP
eukprot:scaffold581_cov263-Pinguiococcus_pyrenoidosus.AAC.19